MNESQTKHELITPALQKSGWDKVEDSKIYLEFPITAGQIISNGRRQNPLKADYVLFYRNRKLAVVEAKAKDKYYTEGVGQAKDYAKRLNIRFAYSTNGERIHEIDLQSDEEKEIKNFPSPEKLWQKTFTSPKNKQEQKQKLWQDKFTKIPFETKGGTWTPRYYQENAINKSLEAITKQQKRILLTLATGTGKTAIAFQIVWKLFHAKWNLKAMEDNSSFIPKVLFLADKNILATQAFNSFSAFDKIDENIKVRISPDEIRKKKQMPKNANIFFTIFQTFMAKTYNQEKNNQNQSEEENFEQEDLEKEEEINFNFGEYPKDFFDLIIIDECHRGGANSESSWRGILEYFSPAVQLGLTATPKRTKNTDTYQYFGEPVYSYSLKDGIQDGFLTPFKLEIIRTTLDEYQHTNDNKVLQGEVEQGDVFDKENQFDRDIQIDARDEYRVKIFLSYINQKEQTIVFCKTEKHALFIRDLINKQAKDKDIDYCQRVTASETLGEQYLKDFQNDEKNYPTILTTSRKLSTGVDASNIRNIVLMRRVDSMIEFKQIIGRGTRLFEGKNYFTIYDFVAAHKNFNDIEWDGDALEINERDKEKDEEKQSLDLKSKSITDEKSYKNLSYIENDKKQKKEMIIIELSPQNYRKIKNMVETRFFYDNKPVSAEDFIKKLYDYLPNHFETEEDLRKIWSDPYQREQFLETIAKQGYTQYQLEHLKEILDAKDSDLFDVLNYIAYEKKMFSREERVQNIKPELKNYQNPCQSFFGYVLEQYQKEGEKIFAFKKIKDLINLYPQKESFSYVANDLKNKFVKIQKEIYGS